MVMYRRAGPEMSMKTIIHYGMLAVFRGSSAQRSRQGNRHHLPECLPTKVRPTHAERDARGVRVPVLLS